MDQPDKFFTESQINRLRELMQQFRAARDSGEHLAPNFQDELEKLVALEMEASGKRAAALVEFGFSESDHARMAELARKSNHGLLTQSESIELKCHVTLGDTLSTLKSEARLAMLRSRESETP